jgi:hypothetical protein
MEDINIQGKKGEYLIPVVHFSANTGVCEMGGESYHENTFEFYHPLIAWLEEFTTEEKRPVVFNFRLSYFNTAASRGITDMLHVLKRYHDRGGKVAINWYYLDWDIDILEEIEDFARDIGIEINTIPIPEEEEGQTL